MSAPAQSPDATSLVLEAPRSEIAAPARAPKLVLIEAARGIAACGVVAHHLDLLLAEPRYLGRQVLAGLLFPGYHGVDFFFVLSGFIVMYAHWQDIGRGGVLRNYFARRATRILPMYWIVTAVLVVLYAFLPSLGKPSQHDTWNAVTSFLLLPTSQTPVLGVAWTLRYEAVFYLVFALVLWRPRWGLSACALWLIAALLSHEPLTQSVSLLSMHNAQFVLGMLACVWVKRRKVSHPLLVAGIGFTLLILMYGLESAFTPRFNGEGFAFTVRNSVATFAYGVASAVAIVGMVALDRIGYSARLPNIFGHLGTASYSVYLTHGALLSFIATVLFKSKLAFFIGPTGTILLLAIGATIGGVGVWRWVEGPLQRQLRAALSR